MTDAFHSLWTKPSAFSPESKFSLPDHEVLVMILSALKWRQKNGGIRMITDSKGSEFLYKNQLNGLYDLGISTALNEIEGVDPYLFWAAGKLYALSKADAPCVMLDIDLIIWEDISGILKECKVMAAHSETLNYCVYPPIDVFKMKRDYVFPAEWDLSADPLNTAFLCISDNEFKKYYTDCAFGFIHNCENGTDAPVNSTVSMCFAEQRLLSMCCSAKGISPKYLLDWDKLDTQTRATHIWGYKKVLSEDSGKREDFCRKCAKRIMRDFPEYSYILKNSSSLAKYLS